MKRRLLKLFIYSALAIMAASVLTFVYWNLEPKDVITLKGPITVKPVIQKSEGAITLHFNYCKNIDVEGSVVQSFVSNKTEIYSPTVKDTGHKGCNSDQSVVLLIPPQVSPDRYRIKYSVTYRVNPIVTTTQTFESEEFDVVSTDTVLPNPLPTTLPNDPNFYNKSFPQDTPSTNGSSSTATPSQYNQAPSSGTTQPTPTTPPPTQEVQKPSVVERILAPVKAIINAL